MKKGFRQEATRMVEALKERIPKSGFSQYYNPYTGEGYGALDFTWPGLVVDMMDMEKWPGSKNEFIQPINLRF